MCFRPPSVGKPKKCPECGSYNPAILKQCRKCGGDLPEPEAVKMTCPRCGAENPASAPKCGECGLTAGEAMVLLRNAKNRNNPQ
jgi:ribosomal protein L40E